MPYYIENDNPDCSGWATVKDDGEVIGCHNTKQDAIDQMVAVSIEEGIEPGGERNTTTRALPDAYRPAVSSDVPEGRACGNCRYYDDSLVNEDGVRAWCTLWNDWVRGDYYCDRWVAAEDDRRQVSTNPPQYVRDAAARGLELREEGHGGDGLTAQTIREARDIARGELTEDKIIRAAAWAARHAASLEAAANNDPDAEGWPGPGAVAHYLWGIDPLDPQPARAWFTGKSEQIKQERSGGMVSTAPNDNVRRRVEFRATPSGDGLTLEGYAAVFDEWTMIDSYEGTFRERVAPGAFRRTIGQRMPVLQFDHGAHPLIGSIPLGRITSITEDTRGLKIRARLSDNWLVEPVRDAIRDGAIDGMSFRFRVIDDSWSRGKDNIAERTIREVELYEVGPVVFPAYEQTTVGVRSRQALDALTDPEVRSEIARLLATGTDISSLAYDDDPATDHSSSPTDPTGTGHSAVRTKTQRRASAYLVLEDITP